MTRRVLVTRPEPGASATAERLKAMGFAPVVLPLTRIVPVTPQNAPEPDGIDAVIVTSVNALRHAPAGLLAALSGKPVFTVGDASAAAAREKGFADVRSAARDAENLSRLIARDMQAGSRLIHLAGVERTPGFEERLHEAGFEPQIVEIYHAQEISYPTDFLNDVASEGPIWGAPVLSTRAGELLSKLAAREPLAQSLGKTLFFCISDKASVPLQPFAASRILVSDEPAEDAVLALLSSQG